MVSEDVIWFHYKLETVVQGQIGIFKLLNFLPHKMITQILVKQHTIIHLLKVYPNFTFTKIHSLYTILYPFSIAQQYTIP